jgi:hypothetical protein
VKNSNPTEKPKNSKKGLHSDGGGNGPNSNPKKPKNSEKQPAGNGEGPRVKRRRIANADVDVHVIGI